ncbi:hypothetical protein LPJ53_004237 [Coemansia erecta]|uniref:Uncharacterized protein n=1 Tax=Coemansia erecta TaxID=147472 RepID=A0A9W7XUR4_9FUNG|nr:hypothetical protein LPJ53_004237 [Coemansia erecta]
MAHLHYIEYAHLDRILRYAAAPRPRCLRDWRAQLRLAHVCGLWSDILLPSLLRTVFVHLSFEQPCSHLPRDSNAHIVYARGFHSYADVLCIEADENAPLASFFDGLLGALDAYACEWAGVRKMSVQMRSTGTEPGGLLDATSMPLPPGNLSAQLELRLLQCMPHVRQLSIDTPGTPYSNIADLLTATYCRQLYCLETNSPLSSPHRQFCRNLTHLDVALDSASKSPLFFPRLSASSLEHLALTNVPPGFSWNEFNDFEGRSLTFANLTYLSLKFSDKHSDHDTIQPKHPPLTQTLRYTLHFPKLRHLSISNCPSKSLLFNSQKYFSNVVEISIDGPLALVSYATDLGLHKHKSVRVSITSAIESQERILYRVSNYFFGQLAVERRAALLLDVDLDQLDVPSIRWTNLTSLVVSSVFKVDCLLRLMFALPNVSSLAAYRLDVNLYSLFVSHDFSEDMDGSSKILPSNTSSWFPQIKLGFYFSYVRSLVSSQKELQRVFRFLPVSAISPVLGTRIKWLALYFDEDSPGTLDLKNEIAVYVLAKIGGLQTAHIDPIFRNPLDILKADLQPACPHLDDIRVNYIPAALSKDQMAV